MLFIFNHSEIKELLEVKKKRLELEKVKNDSISIKPRNLTIIRF